MMLPSPDNTSITTFPSTSNKGTKGTLRIARRGKSNSILLVALFRPKVKNAFNDDLYLHLIALLQQVATEDTLSAIVLTGTGPYFSSGADLNDQMMDVDDDRGMIDKPPGRFMMELLKFPKVGWDFKPNMEHSGIYFTCLLVG